MMEEAQQEADSQPLNGSDTESYSRGDSMQSSESSYDPTTTLMTEINAPEDIASKKRKSPEPDVSIDKSELKRARLALHSRESLVLGPEAPKDRSQQLAPEIWHHIFTHVPPRSLGNLLVVNKLFHNFLEPSPLVKVSYPVFSASSQLPPQKSSRLREPLAPLKPNAIWQASRRRFWPRMPAPLRGRSEPSMWRLACSRVCQFCKMKDQSRSETIPDAWHRGPGVKGVAPVFPFFIVSCGSCLAEKSLKEIDILISSTTPSVLLPAAPAAFLTPDLHVIPPQTMQNDNLSAQAQVTKVYWAEQLGEIKVELETVKRLGSAAAEEWIKGLEARGKRVLADASRWERWEISGGVHLMRRSLTHTWTKDASSHSTSNSSSPKNSGKTGGTGVLHSIRPDGASSKAAFDADKETHGPNSTTTASQPRSLGQGKRTKEEVAELKQKRRAEIERRAALLDPPLTPDVLAHIPSFQAALQITAPVDDNAWEVLRPRLLAQRSEAEAREKENRMSAKTIEDKSNGQVAATRPSRDPKQVTDEEWDEAQGPVRARISSYADEIIKDGWNGGTKLKKSNCAQFAAEVLLYVRRRFYAEVAKDAAAALAAGKEPVMEPPEGPWTQKLTLENMKWVFDLKIKPLTERHRKELFLCNGCPANFKYYGFEGVIQHYAAKHTTALSLGNIVVYWRAEWPETPPFSPDPKIPALQPPAGRQVLQSASDTSQTSPSYSSLNNSLTTYASPHPLANQPPAYVPPTPYAPSSASFDPSAVHTMPYQPPYTSHSYSPSTPYPPYPNTSSYGGPYSQPNHAGRLMSSPSIPPYEHVHGSYHGSQTPGRPSAGDDRARLDFIAQVARRTWDLISHVDGLPGAIKLCTTIHHIAKGFQMQFSHSAPLDMFIFGLSNDKNMRPVRSVNGLKCKACTESMAGNRQVSTFSVPQLLNHFHQTHVESNPQPLDWRTQMVELPQLSVLAELPKMLAYNRAAYDTVADALPWAFNGDLSSQIMRIPENRTSGDYDHVKADQPDDPYSPSYSPAPYPEEPRRASYQPEPVLGRGKLPDNQVYDVDHQVLDRPDLRPASQVYSRAEGLSKSELRRQNKRAKHDSKQNATGPPAAAERSQRDARDERDPTIVTARGPKQPGNLSSTMVPYDDYQSRPREAQRWHEDGRFINAPTTETRSVDHRYEVPGPPEPHYAASPGTIAQVPAARSDAYASGYHPNDPARRAPPPEWHHRQPSMPHRYDEMPQRRDLAPPREVEPIYREAPPQEYELLEVRDPEQGTYLIRRPIRREVYTYDARPPERPLYEGRGRAGTVMPPARGAEYEEYDPRYPATDTFRGQSRYP